MERWTDDVTWGKVTSTNPVGFCYWVMPASTLGYVQYYPFSKKRFIARNLTSYTIFSPNNAYLDAHLRSQQNKSTFEYVICLMKLQPMNKKLPLSGKTYFPVREYQDVLTYIFSDVSERAWLFLGIRSKIAKMSWNSFCTHQPLCQPLSTQHDTITVYITGIESISRSTINNITVEF